MKLPQAILAICGSIFFIACGLGGSQNGDSKQLGTISVQNTSANQNVIAANINESQTNTYTISVSNSTHETYSLVASNIPSGVSVSNNACINIPSSQTCQISLRFSPTSINQYDQNATITLSFVDKGLQNSQNYQLSLMPRSINVQTYPYGQNKSYFQVNVGGGTSAFAEIDTGSQLIVVDFNKTFSGNNQQNTYGTNGTIQVLDIDKNATCYNNILNQYKKGNLTDITSGIINNCSKIVYGNGARPVYGFYASGTVSITAANGYVAVIQNAPMFISNNINNGNSGGDATNNAIFGLNMDSQVSSKNFLPYPLNQSIVINKPNAILTFGQLTPSQTAYFDITQLQTTSSCQNVGYPITSSTPCWDSQSLPITYNYGIRRSDYYCNTSNGVPDDRNNSAPAPSLIDSGAGNASFQYPIYPNSGYLTWAVCSSPNSQNVTSIISLQLGSKSINLPSTVNYEQNSGTPKVNIGNAIFSQYQILFNQNNGAIGLANPTPTIQ